MTLPVLLSLLPVPLLPIPLYLPPTPLGFFLAHGGGSVFLPFQVSFFPSSVDGHQL